MDLIKDGKTCPSCSNEILDGSKFCAKCGFSLGENKLENASPKNNTMMVVTMIAVIICISAISVGAWMVISSRDSAKDKNAVDKNAVIVSNEVKNQPMSPPNNQGISASAQKSDANNLQKFIGAWKSNGLNALGSNKDKEYLLISRTNEKFCVEDVSGNKFWPEANNGLLSFQTYGENGIKGSFSIQDIGNLNLLMTDDKKNQVNMSFDRINESEFISKKKNSALDTDNSSQKTSIAPLGQEVNNSGDYTKPIQKTTYLGELQTVNSPPRYFVDGWHTYFSGKFKMNGRVYNRGIGFYVPSQLMTYNLGSESLVYSLDKKYKRFTFDLGVEQNWCYGYGYGDFKVKIYADNYIMFDSGWQNYSYFATKSLDVTGVNTLVIEVEETKGIEGTSNIVMGDAMLQ